VTRTEEVAVPGARLHTEVRGSGPLLVCVVGGNGDPTVFAPLADLLAPRWTVLTYVRRGFVRSPVDGAVGPDKLHDDVEDLAVLVERHGGSAVVLGSSSGAIVTLELLVRRPELVRAAVAHEPPLITLLDDHHALAARFDAVLDTFRRDGAPAAMAEFGELTGVGVRRPPPERQRAEVPPEFRVMRERMAANNAFWFDHEYRSYPEHRLDLAALRRRADRLVLPVGAVSTAEGQLPSRPAFALAHELGVTPVEVPGGHLGYLEDPGGFAAGLEAAVAPLLA
jgi:acetyltransferase/esterase